MNATYTSWTQLITTGIVLCLVQFLAAIPWVALVTTQASLFRFTVLRRFLPQALVASLVAGLLTAGALRFEEDREFLASLGRIYGAVLYFQLVLDFFVLA